MKFEITPEEQKQIDAWYQKLVENSTLYYGAAGGGLTYSFHPTSIGVVTVVKEALTGEELNLTDYDSW